MPDATLTRLIRPTVLQRIEITGFVDRKGVHAASGIRCSMPDATLTALIRPTVLQRIEITGFVGRISVRAASGILRITSQYACT